MSITRAIRKPPVLIGLLALLTLLIFLLNSKSVQISREDQTYLKRFLTDWHLVFGPNEVHRNLKAELDFISHVQDSVLSNITGEQIPHAYFGNVRYYYQKRQGICYDRAVLIEKLLMLYHFSVRHVYIYFRQGNVPGRTDFFKKGLSSHASVEVKTQKGWMAIGTDANWLGIDTSHRLLTYFELRDELKRSNGFVRLEKPASSGEYFWKDAGAKFRIIYGIYSRHGDLFTGASEVNTTSLFTNKHHLLPDYNARMLLYNL